METGQLLRELDAHGQRLVGELGGFGRLLQLAQRVGE